MKATTIFICCFLYIIFCTLSKAEVKSQRYIVESSLDNTVSNVSLIGIYHAESLTECSAMCDELSSCFGFNPQLKKCRVHQSCVPSNMTINETGWRYFCPSVHWDSLLKSCMEIVQSSPTVKGKNGVYSMKINDQRKKVYCDMTTDGGGWTVIQKRQDGSTDFYKTWADYKKGFGDPCKNYWIGNDAIHSLTKTNQELRVELLSFADEKAYARYSTFKVGDESSKYRLTVSDYSGTAGDSLEDHNGMKFSTPDQDNDLDSRHCAVEFHGGWWFNACHPSNLNGEYAGSALTGWRYLIWYHWKSVKSLKGSAMLIRPQK